MKNLCLKFILLLTVLIYISCSTEDTPIDPKNDILGKWELVQQGTSLENLNDVPPSGYTEYLDDKKYRFYDYDTKEFIDGDYSLDDSVLTYFYYAVENGQVVDTVPVRYFYTFTNKRRLILDIDAFALQDFFVYKKIE